MRNLQHKLSVARGEKPAELVFRNARLVNVLSAEIYLTNVAVDDGRVIPALKLTDQGLVDAVNLKLTSLFDE